jgi:hypothetical protein
MDYNHLDGFECLQNFHFLQPEERFSGHHYPEKEPKCKWSNSELFISLSKKISLLRVTFKDERHGLKPPNPQLKSCNTFRLRVLPNG